MVDIIIKGDNELHHVVKVSKYSSIYTLKFKIHQELGFPIDDQVLEIGGRTLTNHYPLSHYKLGGGGVVELRLEGRGGAPTTASDVLVWSAWALAVAAVIGYMIFGIVPLVGYAYSYALDMALNRLTAIVDWLFKINLGNSDIYNILMGILKMVINYGGMFFFLYALVAVVMFPMFYLRDLQFCPSLFISGRIGYVVCGVFFLFYSMFNLADILLIGAKDVAEIPDDLMRMLTSSLGQKGCERVVQDIQKGGFSTEQVKGLSVRIRDMIKMVANKGLIGMAIDPIVHSAKIAIDRAKFWPLYWMPVVGQVIYALHSQVDSAALTTVATLNNFRGIDCSTDSGQTKIRQLLAEWELRPDLRDLVQNWKLGWYMKFLRIAFGVPAAGEQKAQNLAALKEIMRESRGLDKIKIGYVYYPAKIMRAIACLVFYVMGGLDGFVQFLGGSAYDITNIIKTGMVAGVFAAVVVIVFVIVGFLKKSMFCARYNPEDCIAENAYGECAEYAADAECMAYMEYRD